MDVIIQSLGFQAGESLEAFIKEKVSQLKSDNIIRANVRLSFTQDKSDENKCCEIVLEVPGNDMFVKRVTAHFESAANACVDVLHLNLKKEKEKRLDKRQADADLIRETIEQFKTV
ncbi:MAG TPA: HPF/RaiA family ribosome-associated protein [Ferruginibacter sp.]|nr:HPF/RaiA family ribosome-associated protein [Ferruginibacter sp.]HRN79704.1 HPF/RaiA family ribosome-associated protein [Ferruginibacter sp.]HRQ20257.1 HPF/RaiA family ribosome-associated protein [Ferruginibacter sp.]